MVDIKLVIQSVLGESFLSLDDSVVDYCCSIIEDGEEEEVEELADMVKDLLVDSLCDEDEEQVFQRAKLIVEKAQGDSSNKNSEPQRLESQVHLGAHIAEAERLAHEQMKKSRTFSQIDPTAAEDDDRLTEIRHTLVNKDALEKEEIRQQEKLRKRGEKEEKKKEELRRLARAQQRVQMTDLSLITSDPLEWATARNCTNLHLKNIQLFIAGKELLKPCSLSLRLGGRFGLVGRNGIGKTTLLRAIGAREVDLPSGLHILHVEQEVEGDDTLAIDAVLSADPMRTYLLQQEAVLSDLSKTDPAAQEKLQRVYTVMAELELEKSEAKAHTILAGLGFTSEMQHQPTRSFSGGWRMRLSLASALFCEPDLLMLDEPTNMLDINAVLWLEDYLLTFKRCLILVSHDRDFLNNVATDIIHFQGETLKVYRGNYEAFETLREQRLSSMKKENESKERHREHIQKFIDRFRYNAKRASLVQSRLKMLQRLGPLNSIIEDPSICFQFESAEKLDPPVLQFKDVTFGYSPDKILFSNVELGFDCDSRVALIGPNGKGKSTLLKLVMGMIEPVSGFVYKNSRLRLGYFSQHHVDTLELGTDPVHLLQSRFPGKQIVEYRQHLGKYGIIGDTALQKIDTLSGGQKSRVMFALIALSQPHIILMDEPENHLDLDSVDALAEAVNLFDGGVVMVSHNKRLISLTCNELWLVDDGDCKLWEGDFERYRKEKVVAEMAKYQ
eukprot:GCRY01000349.1.p1 GENE.GCRY01000349.1~~GCRY01000349.1.p1  ORF type:complete len:727 (+),score=258.10 GCRY01000349.1:157-2337(+)